MRPIRLQLSPTGQRQLYLVGHKPPAWSVNQFFRTDHRYTTTSAGTYSPTITVTDTASSLSYGLSHSLVVGSVRHHHRWRTAQRYRGDAVQSGAGSPRLRHRLRVVSLQRFAAGRYHHQFVRYPLRHAHQQNQRFLHPAGKRIKRRGSEGLRPVHCVVAAVRAFFRSPRPTGARRWSAVRIPPASR